MNPDLFPQHWLTNRLLDDGFIVQKISALTPLFNVQRDDLPQTAKAQDQLRSFKVMANKRPEYLTLLA